MPFQQVQPIRQKPEQRYIPLTALKIVPAVDGVLEYDTMNTYKCQHNGDVAPHACHIFRFPVKNEKVYYKWNYYKSQWKKQTFPLTFQHKDNSFSLYDTNDSKSQCRDKKLQLVGCEKSPI